MPNAKIVPAPRVGSMALLPWLALAFAVLLVWQTWGERGRTIIVQAQDGYGIAVGDPLRYRGITIGEIEAVDLATDLARVELSVRLQPSADGVARADSQFWIVRPHLSLDSVTGLETVIGARYLAVRPGSNLSPRADTFQALPEPPLDEQIEPGGLQIVLDAPRRFSLAPGAPLSFRQVRIGTVTDVQLASDSTAVEVYVYVRPAYASLVRAGSQFWKVGGVELGLGLVDGLRVEIESLRSLLVGGLALGTPEDAGLPVQDGHRFTLHAKPKEEWLVWRPSMSVGGEDELAPLVPVQGVLSWTQGRVFKSKRERVGWLTLVGDTWVGPAELLTPVADARETAVLMVGTRPIPLVDEPAWSLRGIAGRKDPEAGASESVATARVRLPVAPEDCVIGAPGELDSVALSAARMRPVEDRWAIDEGFPVDPGWHGAPILARADGQLIGVLIVVEDGAYVAPMPIELVN